MLKFTDMLFPDGLLSHLREERHAVIDREMFHDMSYENSEYGNTHKEERKE